MQRLYVGTALIALVTLMSELIITRVFDVVLAPNVAYMVVTCAMFAFGLAGVFAAIWRVPGRWETRRVLSLLSFLFALSLAQLLPVLNSVPFHSEAISGRPYSQVFYFGVIYLAVMIPFFLAGLIFAILFATYAERIQPLYFWDLSGAAVGSVIFVPFLPSLGPAALLYCAAGIALFACALFSSRRPWALGAALLGGIAIAAPLLYGPRSLEFRLHSASWLQAQRDAGQVETRRWDPISTVEVSRLPDFRQISYDGGNQISIIFPFDGDFEALRASYADKIFTSFWNWETPMSHYLKRDSDQRVLIVGGGGGQETKAALMFGASHVDVVELVGTVVDWVKGRYASFGGNLYHHPKVRVRAGEGRNLLRATDEKYDIIQIYSNHTSSSVAAGTGAMATTYLQTAEAYQEYIGHLTEDGVLHINQFYYPRMVTTAALAWQRLGREDFQKHVLVVASKNAKTSFLLKNSPWTQAELAEIRAYMEIPGDHGHGYEFWIAENPLAPEENFLSPAFYTLDPAEWGTLEEIVPYRIWPATDNRPYFKFIREQIETLEASEETFVNPGTARILNSQLLRPYIPMDVAHLLITSIVALVFVVLCVLVPLGFVKFGEMALAEKLNLVVYFSCLGGGFIIFELIFIQVFMHFIGSPLYAYSTVLFTMLLAAGLGSMSSHYLGITARSRWIWPFVGILVTGILLLAVHREVFDIFLGAHLLLRVLVSGLLMLPLGFFLGMPFPLGILALVGKARGAAAWAWGLNGLFTVVGGLSSVWLSIFLGFRATLVIALALYVLAFLAYAGLRRRLVWRSVGSPSFQGPAGRAATG